MQTLRSSSIKPEPQSDIPSRALVVDVSGVQRKILSASLVRWGFQVYSVSSCAEALEVCQTNPPDLVICEWMMPNMNGLEFCQAFRAIPRENYGYFILVSSRSEKIEVMRGLEIGVDDFLTKPMNASELQARIKAGQRIIDMHRSLTEQNTLVTDTLAELRTVYDAIDQDLLQARKIQQALVPERQRDFGTSRVSLLLQPCGHVGGDLVGVLNSDQDHVGFYCIDVSGHGITSALMTAQVGRYLNNEFPDYNIAMRARAGGGFDLRSPQEVAHLLNQRLAGDSGVIEYFTMVYGTVDLHSGEVDLVQAGHPHPLLIRADGGMEFLGAGGLPIGLVADATYSVFKTYLKRGDRLFLYSDGFTECKTKHGDMLEEDGLLELVRSCDVDSGGLRFLDELFAKLKLTMASDAQLDDDISAALFEFNRLAPD